MQLVVEISEDTFFDLKKKQNRTEVDNAVLSGTPLPKGHGRIVDIGQYEGKVIASRKYCGVNKLVEVAEIDTIIEADTTYNPCDTNPFGDDRFGG